MRRANKSLDLALKKTCSMPQRRTNKHIPKKERDDVYEKLVTRKNAQYLVNALIDRGHVPDFQSVVRMLQKINDEMGGGEVFVCQHCARKIGVRHCSGCARTAETSYCSRECQIAAWPMHKGRCGSNAGVIDVD
jgi:hypothetical protein